MFHSIDLSFLFLTFPTVIQFLNFSRIFLVVFFFSLQFLLIALRTEEEIVLNRSCSVEYCSFEAVGS